MSIHSFAFPTPIQFGAGARKLVGPHLLAAGCKRPLIVTDKALGALPVLAEFRTHLGGLDVAVFSGVFGNPTCSQVMDGALAFKAHHADCVIGFGGGAALDVAKIVGLAATHDKVTPSRAGNKSWAKPTAHTGWPDQARGSAQSAGFCTAGSCTLCQRPARCS